jgi:hypothetical protein
MRVEVQDLAQVELISQYRDPDEDRQVPIAAYMLELPAPNDWPTAPLALSSSYFVLFAAAEFSQFSLEQWMVFANRAMDAGCAYVCVWGPGCEKLHDLFDLERGQRDPDAKSDRFLMTTWHASDSLDDALWFALFAAIPGDDTVFSGTTSSIVACSVGGHSATEIRSRLQNVDAFSERVLADKPD